jgi:hypothetical protein
VLKRATTSSRTFLSSVSVIKGPTKDNVAGFSRFYFMICSSPRAMGKTYSPAVPPRIQPQVSCGVTELRLGLKRLDSGRSLNAEIVETVSIKGTHGGLGARPSRSFSLHPSN